MASNIGRPARRGTGLWIALALAAALPGSAIASCLSSGRAASVEQIVERVHAEHLKYVFIGERHGVGPVKRFAVDLTNALADAGDDVGLYVEGFRTNCRLGDRGCPSLARWFNESAFSTLLGESRASVHAIDPVERDLRASRMAASVSEGAESIRVVLVGRVHVVHAEDNQAELWVYGGSVKYADPGDVVEAFPRREYLTVELETIDGGREPYLLRQDGCAADYVLVAPNSRDYWTGATPTHSAAIDSRPEVDAESSDQGEAAQSGGR